MTEYPPVTGPYLEDDGTMPENVAALASEIVGHKIVEVRKNMRAKHPYYSWHEMGTGLVLDNGKIVVLIDTSDCCAYTELQEVIEHLPLADHVITNVTPEEDYDTWHIFADLGEVLELKVGWSSGNPFYYGYGFCISVVDAEGNDTEE